VLSQLSAKGDAHITAIAEDFPLVNNPYVLHSIRGYSMTMKFQGALRAGVLIIAAAVAAGCASVTSDQLDMVRSTAEAAQKTAQSAQQAADQARQAASGAQSTANEALQAAQAAQAANQQTNEKLDRMFKQSQRK
jgi:uncharacterized protein HemX